MMHLEQAYCVYKDTCKDGHFDTYKYVYLTVKGSSKNNSVQYSRALWAPSSRARLSDSSETVTLDAT